MENIKIITILVTVLMWSIIFSAPLGFATNESVEGKLKEVPEPSEPTPTPPPEPPFELDNETKAIIIDLLSKEFNKTADEIEVLSAGKTYEEGRIAVRTNLGIFTYKDGAIYPVDIRIEPEVNETEAYTILKSELIISKGIIPTNTTELLFTINRLHYERKADLNFYPSHYIYNFYFTKSLDNKKAVYEKWAVNIDATLGDITRLDKTHEVSFYNIKTREDAAKLLKEKKGIDADPSGISMAFLSGGRGFWAYATADLSYIIRDDGTITEQEKDVPFSDEGLGQIRVSKLSPPILKIAIGLFLLLVVIGGYFVLKKRRS